jgi:16S rRNA (uracil1498-N3)-methyltransferase
MTRRRWIADDWNDRSAFLRDTQAAHLARVLRAQPGQEFDIVVDGFVRRGIVVSVSSEAVEFSLHEAIETAGALPLVLGLSIVRFEPMEWAIEKLTELGAARIVPLIAQRSEKHLAQAAAKRVERWRKIARESAQQSRRSDVPEIIDPLPLSQWLKEDHAGLKLVLSEIEQTLTLPQALAAKNSSQEIHAAIGPEGGWTERELALFAEQRWQSITLGPRILRAETAAIVLAGYAAQIIL